MKKTALISILLLVSLLFGCANNADPSSGTEPASSAEENVTTSDNEETTAGDPEKSEEEALAEYYKNYLDSEDFGYNGASVCVNFRIKRLYGDEFSCEAAFAPGYFRFGFDEVSSYSEKTLEIINSGRYIDFTTSRIEQTQLPDGRTVQYDAGAGAFDTLDYEYREIRRYKIRNKDVFPEEAEKLKNLLLPCFELEGEMTYVESHGSGDATIDIVTCGNKTVHIYRNTKKILNIYIDKDRKMVDYEYFDKNTDKNAIAELIPTDVHFAPAEEEIALPGYRSGYEGYMINAEAMSYEESKEWFFKELNDYICDIVHLVDEE